jgi:hypothetical protein
LEAKGKPARRVSKYAVGLVVAGGVLWVVGAVTTVIPHLRCFSCGALFGTSGARGVVGYPTEAARDLAWADIFASLFIATGGIAGLLNTVLDQLEWGGWFTIVFYGLFPTLGLLLATKSFFPGKPKAAPS